MLLLTRTCWFRFVLSILFMFYVNNLSAQWQERFPPSYPIDGQNNLLDRLWPDFRVKQVRVRQLGGYSSRRWEFVVWIENIGGNRGLNHVAPPYLPVRIDVKACLQPDYGHPNFSCPSPTLTNTSIMALPPRAGETKVGGGTRYFSPPFVHDVYVDVNVQQDGTHGPFQEYDSPYRGNNKAFIQTIYDPRRSSYSGFGWWIWPNDEDTIPY